MIILITVIGALQKCLVYRIWSASSSGQQMQTEKIECISNCGLITHSYFFAKKVLTLFQISHIIIMQVGILYVGSNHRVAAHTKIAQIKDIGSPSKKRSFVLRFFYLFFNVTINLLYRTFQNFAVQIFCF